MRCCAQWSCGIRTSQHPAYSWSGWHAACSAPAGVHRLRCTTCTPRCVPVPSTRLRLVPCCHLLYTLLASCCRLLLYRSPSPVHSLPSLAAFTACTYIPSVLRMTCIKSCSNPKHSCCTCLPACPLMHRNGVRLCELPTRCCIAPCSPHASLNDLNATGVSQLRCEQPPPSFPAAAGWRAAACMLGVVRTCPCA